MLPYFLQTVSISHIIGKTVSAMHIQLLAYSSCCFCGAAVLDADHLNEVRDTTEVVLLIFLAGKPVDVDGDCSIRFFLSSNPSF